ncbi:MAG: type II secretion system F family protein [Gammaproteobacteria bacterium]|nr:type II secretion system F family protein [Gammaproteobacteria bacterium]MDH3416126.1 type II secretion system F family protein [Gammaproteobacteria bacterium]
MEALLDLLNSYWTDEVVLRRLLVGLSAATIFILALGLSNLIMNMTSPVRRRMGLVHDDQPDKGRLKMFVNTAMGPVAGYVLPQKNDERDDMTQKLARAGFRSPQALQTFYMTKSLLAVTLPMLVLFGWRWFPDIEGSTLTYAMAASGIGLLGPNFILRKLIDRRVRSIRNGFPDALDLLVVCVESGLGLASAIQRVADELFVSHPELAFELSTVNAEIRAGMPREQALRNLADRTGLPDIKGLVGLLVQTMRFGTSVSDALRIYSDEFRDKRMQMAEEQAAKMGTKLVFPLIFCMFPVFFIVAIGPAVLAIMDWISGK